MKKSLAFSNETEVIQRLLQDQDHNNTFVDIGAGELEVFSNSRDFLDMGYKGYLFDINPTKASEGLRNIAANNLNATYIVAPVSPWNINELLVGLEVPRKFSCLSIDIDSYDLELCRSILGSHTPKVIVVEINERVPPWINYELLYDKAIVGKDRSGSVYLNRYTPKDK